MTAKVAFITGIAGQDGSYLAEILAEKGYAVHGLVRPAGLSAAGDEARMAGKAGRIYEAHAGDLTDWEGLNALIARIRPDEIYNLAAQSHVGDSFGSPVSSVDVNATGVLRLLEAIRANGLGTRFFQASTSELFGKAVETPQSETTPFHPRSPYGVAKAYGFWITRQYREAYGMHAGNGILFNHESPRRGENFVTRKITLSLARLKTGGEAPLRLGNIDARRDWGFARDYAEMMWLMLQQPAADDYVAATGEAHTVREFVETAAACCGYDLLWEGEAAAEKGRDRKSGRLLVEIDPAFFRPLDSELLVGNPEKALRNLGWKPRVRFPELVEMMMKADLEEAARTR